MSSHETAADGFRYFFGAASGSARKALRQLEEPNVMLNYATQNNQPWDGIERLFVDSGGYSFILGKGEYKTTDAEYLNWIAERDPELWALRDYPCEPEVLHDHGRTVNDHQQMTVDRHRNLLNRLSDHGISGQPVAVLQGWDIDDYLQCVDRFQDAGLLTDHVGIGSVCRRNAEAEIRRVVLAVRDAVPSRVSLHAFGVKSSVLKYPDVRDALATADSQSYEYQAQWASLEATGAGTKTFRDSALAYLKQRQRIQTLLAGDKDAATTQQMLEAYDTAAAGGQHE